MQENPPPFAPLEDPRSLLRLDEGMVISDASLLVEKLARLLGFVTYSTKEKDIGEPYSTTRVLSFKDDKRERSVVVKNYTDVRSLKWALLGIWASPTKRFSTAPLSRMDREYGITLALQRIGVLVPEILAVAPSERILVKDFVEGQTLSAGINALFRGTSSDVQAIADYGETLAKVHSAGIAVGDAKPSNVVVSRQGLYLTDLEQAFQGGDKAWDLAEFLYYTAKLSNREDAMNRVATAFLEGYLKSGDKSVVSRARGQKYIGPFRPFLTPGMTKMLRDRLSAYA
jgi:tRNA A-37 threonylcarbamoyl transferase component Bud32